MTLVRMLRRPRWAMPTSISSTPIMAAIFDHRLERRDRAFAAVEAEALGADIFAGEEFFPLLGVDDLGQDRLLALGRELDGVVGALDPLLDEAPLLDLVDVHIFEADVAAVVVLQHLARSARTVACSKPSAPQIQIGRSRSASVKP